MPQLCISDLVSVPVGGRSGCGLDGPWDLDTVEPNSDFIAVAAAGGGLGIHEDGEKTSSERILTCSHVVL